MSVDRTRLARQWHTLSDHAADGTPFGGGLCNCIKVSANLEKILEDRLAQELKTIGDLLRLTGDYQAVLDALAESLVDWSVITKEAFLEAFTEQIHDCADLIPEPFRE